MFIDQAKIFVQAGKGGDGIRSFRREKFVPHGGPDGGDGGNGGNVIFTASPRVTTLLDFLYQRHHTAQSGTPGQGSNMHGRTGHDIIIPVPVGTVIRDDAGDDILMDLTEPEQCWTAAHGGKGGRGNARFSSSTNRVPQKFERGTPGESQWLRLELKLLADVGLVGFPNAGKSTLISAISSAHPEVADYPFTTLRPHLGVVALNDDHTFVVADIPGLIEGAHEGKGLGFQFLRHIQRTAFLVYLVDMSEWATEIPVDSLHILQRELAAFDPSLAERASAVVGTKLDIQGNGTHQETLATYCQQHSLPFFPISAVTQTGIDPLLHYLGTHIHRPAQHPCTPN